MVRPRKSNFTSPIASTSSLSSCEMTCAPSAAYSGQKSVSRPGAISTPPACMPTLRTRPSSFSESASSSRTSSSFFSRSASSGSVLRASSSVISFPGCTGTSFASWSQKLYGRSSTRPQSRSTARAAMVPKVAICETLSSPYFLRT